jgi:hypothetical protein
MARSRPRRSSQVKAQQERTARHNGNLRLKAEKTLIFEVITGILRDRPPVYKEEVLGREEIEAWFDTDPEAPVMVFARPLEVPTSPDQKPRIQLSVNERAIERELRARGLDERHPAWDLALKVVGPALMDLAADSLQEALARFRAAEEAEG